LKTDLELLGFLGLMVGDCAVFEELSLRRRVGERVGETETHDMSELREGEALIILGSYELLSERTGPRACPGKVWERDWGAKWGRLRVPGLATKGMEITSSMFRGLPMGIGMLVVR
jgi:hypothetical protein